MRESRRTKVITNVVVQLADIAIDQTGQQTTFVCGQRLRRIAQAGTEVSGDALQRRWWTGSVWWATCEQRRRDLITAGCRNQSPGHRDVLAREQGSPRSARRDEKNRHPYGDVRALSAHVSRRCRDEDQRRCSNRPACATATDLRIAADNNVKARGDVPVGQFFERPGDGSG
jgi:hypothetical protein